MASSQRQNITAIIYDKRGRVLAIGKNNYTKTHPMQAHYAKRAGEEKKIFLHAEIDAIAKCKNLDKAYRIFVMRTDGRGQYKLAAPCEICRGAINETPIRVIEHT